MNDPKPRVLVVGERPRSAHALLAMVAALQAPEPRYREPVYFMHPDEYAERTGGHVKTAADFERIRAAQAKRARRAAKLNATKESK